MKIKVLVVLMALVCVPLITDAKKREKKKKAGKTENVQTPKESAYDKLFKGKECTTAKGMITLHKVDGKLYFEFPLSLLGRDMLLGSTVSSISDNSNALVGQKNQTPLHVAFTMTDSMVYLREVTNPSRAQISSQSKDKHIEQAMEMGTRLPIMEGFAVKAYNADSTAVVFEATKFFVSDDSRMDPFDPYGKKVYYGQGTRRKRFQSELSYVGDIKAFSDNVSITSSLSYLQDIALHGMFVLVIDEPVTVGVNRSLVLLPEEPRMRPRLADPRVGTLWSDKVSFSDEAQGSEVQYWVNRWNLTEEKPIVFYVDTLLPESWQRCVYRSADIWNKSFQKIGFPNALVVKPYPKDGTVFDANNITKSCIRYIISPSNQITDNCWSDPLTGEIISANIYIPHNLASKIQLNYFLQTASFNEKARTLMPDEDLVEEALTSLLLRHWGHCLGLTDNMAGSIAYPVDSLQSKEFVKKHGLSASVMDKLPMNYLLSVDNYSADIPLTQQVLGEYDHWAIRYLYQPMNKKTPQEELSDLRKLVSERNQNPLLLFKRPQSRKAYYDPRGMEMDLGNDAIRAATIAFENLGKVVANANQWLDKEDFNYEKRASLYGEIINQADEYVKHVLQQVGGIYLNDSYQGDSYPSYQPVSKELQRRSYQWMMEAISQMNWLDNRELLNHCALTGSAADYSQKFFANLLLIQLNNLWLSESKSSDPYTQQQAVEDLKNHLFKETRAGKEPDDWKRFLQGQLLSFVISWSNVNVPKGKDETANASSKLTIQTVCPYRGMTAIESIPYSSAPERAPFWYGCLLDLKSEFTRAKSVAPNREMQEEYDYRLFTIEKALRK